ncbi:discoidin domain-containing protein [Stigmatella aurantiaca]|uniref:Coagulation factor 5/8 type domain protein n=1 Tax=Stigmatella aurantiaca (strain DW4/3-1) TaxID=378806 RepID=Q08Y79_STIAD|nr:discoidin domain-containing protein [Stigmatella aurantiaca]ADO67952.1 Coagulation factor 5/8 type domain protein [Stigmatella aurantiaca DW4/3-1]EAU65437.1 putative secreted protein [Stigmatella aurantiaca DW4/3-1]
MPLILNGANGTASLEWRSSRSLDAATGTVSSPSLVNPALGKPATASSTASGFAASRANDGNDQAAWKASGVTWPSWWQVDLGAARSILYEVQLLGT